MPWQIVPGLAVEGGQYNLKNQSRTAREGGDCASVFAVAKKGQSRIGSSEKTATPPSSAKRFQPFTDKALTWDL
ncbi:hypothetical protein [Ensifer adhaerens]|uniref:hypothetical protein n=1 Tax=Ensifer adhaerens TaxID=106592 RepID=UPI001146ECDF|nr:hypothetical protein [Ensifer adhaerens]